MNKTVFEYEPLNSPKNIDIIFQKIVYNLIECISFEEYSESKKKFEEILVKVRQWIADYVNNFEVLNINSDELENVRKDIEDLDNYYIMHNGLYVEDLYEWMIQLCVVNIKRRGE